MIPKLFKLIWWLRWNVRSTAKSLYFRCLPGAYFEGIGPGVVFYGRVRFGSVEGNIRLGKECLVGHDLFFSASRGSRIEIGDNVSLNTGCHLVATAGIEIGADTRIAEYCSIRDQQHIFEDRGAAIRTQGFHGERIRIGRDVWVGRGVFIGPGVTIGDGCVIGANSVVTHDIAPFSIAVGAPARVIGIRGEPK